MIFTKCTMNESNDFHLLNVNLYVSQNAFFTKCIEGLNQMILYVSI